MSLQLVHAITLILARQESTNLPTILPPTSTQSAAQASIGSFLSDSALWQIVDPEIARENPVEDKHRRLIRSHRSGALDRELKPNAKDRDELAVKFIPKLILK